MVKALKEVWGENGEKNMMGLSFLSGRDGHITSFSKRMKKIKMKAGGFALSFPYRILGTRLVPSLQLSVGLLDLHTMTILSSI